MEEKVNFTPEEWYHLWQRSVDNVAYDRATYFKTKLQLQKKLIAANDELFNEKLLKKEAIEEKRRQKILRRTKEIGGRYTRFVHETLENEKILEKERQERIREWKRQQQQQVQQKAKESDQSSVGLIEGSNMASYEDHDISMTDFGSTGTPFQELIPPRSSHPNIVHKAELRRLTETEIAKAQMEGLFIAEHPDYVHYVENKDFPKPIRLALKKTLGEYLANYFMDYNANPVRPKLAELQNIEGGMGARKAWSILRNASLEKIKLRDIEIRKKAQDSIERFTRTADNVSVSSVPLLKRANRNHYAAKLLEDQAKIYLHNKPLSASQRKSLKLPLGPGKFVCDEEISEKKESNKNDLDIPEVQIKGLRFLKEEDEKYTTNFREKMKEKFRENPKNIVSDAEALEILENLNKFKERQLQREDPSWKPLSLNALEDYSRLIPTGKEEFAFGRPKMFKWNVEA